MFTTHRSWRFIFPALYFRSLSRKVFHSFQGSFLGLLAKHGIVSLSASVLKGMDSDTLAMCAIWSCLCGDRMAPNILFVLLHRGTASASRFGTVRTTDMGRGYARRHLRHNLYLTAQPLSPCKTQNYTVAKLEAQVCVRVCVCGSWRPSEMGDWHFFGTADKEANTLFASDVIFKLSALLHPVYSLYSC